MAALGSNHIIRGGIVRCASNLIKRPRIEQPRNIWVERTASEIGAHTGSRSDLSVSSSSCIANRFCSSGRMRGTTETSAPATEIKLLTHRSEIEPYVGEIRTAADSEKTAFGFLPAKAYDEFAYQGRMIVAVDASDALVGYTLFGGALPQGRIFQTWASPNFRGHGVGRRLLLEVIRVLEKSSYLSVRADVASDLVDANGFYSELGFEVIRTRPGGRTRGRTINVRVRELSTPSLLDFANASSSSLGSLTIDTPSAGRAPLYVLDLNVIFDVTKQRVRGPAASRVMATAFENDVRLAITAELVKELERHSKPGNSDPVLELAKALPRLPLPPRSIADAHMAELAPIVFPDRARDGNLTVQDRSDLMHLVAAIHECAAGFVTSEKAILRAAKPLHSRYALDVVSPEAFSPDQGEDYGAGNNVVATAGSLQFEAGPLQEQDYADVETLLTSAHASVAQVRSVLSQGTATLPRRRFIVRANGKACAVAAWDSPARGVGHRELWLWGDEGNPATLIALEHLLGRIAGDLGASRPSTFRMTVPTSQPTVRQAAIGNGFFLADSDGPRSRVLTKIALGLVVTPDNWAGTSDAIHERSKISFPKECPGFAELAQPIKLQDDAGKSAAPSLAEVERLLSPALLVLPHRPAVILPIKQAYAEELFQGSSQPLLLAKREALLHSVRGYIGGPNTYSVIREGAIVVFYESSTGGGRSAATAIARISRRYLMDKASASQYSSKKGVLDTNVIQGMGVGPQVCVSEFEDLMLFRKPVSLAALRLIGCADGANFVTARAISTDHLLAIIKAGEPND